MQVSVVVPFYNAEQYIEQCIEAILSQGFPSDQFDIIFIDNNSTDKSSQIVKKYPQITLLSETNTGSYAARNRGILETKGEILAFTDPDCIPEVNWLDNLVKAIQKPNVGVVLGRRLFASNSLRLNMLVAYESQKINFVSSGDIKEVYFGYTNNMGVHRFLFDRLGLFMELTRGADTVFVRRVVDEFSTDAVIYASDVCVRHMEIGKVGDYIKKQPIRGRNNELNASISSFRPLNFPQRLKLFSKTILNNQYSVIESIYLFTLLAIGGISYDFGRLQARWNLRKRVSKHKQQK